MNRLLIILSILMPVPQSLRHNPLHLRRSLRRVTTRATELNQTEGLAGTGPLSRS